MRRWCERRATTVKQAVEKLGLPLRDPRQEHAAIWRKGEAIVATCPVPMGGAGQVDILYSLACALPAGSRVLETGVAFGWSSLALLLGLREAGGGSLLSIDRPYPLEGAERQVGIVVPPELRPGWRLLTGNDRDLLTTALAEGPAPALCHYDSDKSFDGRSWAYPLIWANLSVEGWFISDDISDNAAFRHFAQRVGQRPVVMDRPARNGAVYSGLLIKRNTRPLRPWRF
jgi:hypothetical protein